MLLFTRKQPSREKPSMKFIGRKEELKKLKRAYSTEEYEGILVYGRRRIGKSELIKESYKEEDCKVVYYECVKVSEDSNTRAFSEIIGHIFDIPTPMFASFGEAVDFLFKRSTKEKIILVLDEYPYIRDKIQGCDSIFQRIIDTYAMNCKMKLILCGSYVDIMERLIREDNPLYKRISVSLNVKQMDYYESAMFYPDFSNEDKVKIYSVFGGLPYYNNYIDDSKTVRENIIELVSSKGARFENDPIAALETEISKITNANEAFLAIAKGKAKFSDILNHSHVSSSPTLDDTLKKLILMDVVKKEYPINDETEKKSLYSISDRLSRFYYRYILPRISYFSTMPSEAFYEEFIEKDFESQFVPKEFEEITKQYLIRKNLSGHINPPLYKVGKYYYDDAKNRKNGEFDVVTLNKYGYDFYEVKFTDSPIGDSVINEELTQLKDLQLKYNKLGFVSKSGFTISDTKDYILISLDDIYN